MRLGLHLELSQLLGIFYSHIGFYMNQALVNRATKATFCELDATEGYPPVMNIAIESDQRNCEFSH